MRKGLLWFVLLLFCVVCVVGQPPFNDPQVGGDVSSLRIVYPAFNVFLPDSSLVLHFHVFNGTGKLLDNSSVRCSADVFDGFSGLVAGGELGYDVVNKDFEFFLNDSVVRVGESYSFIVWCNSSEGFHGFSSAGFGFFEDNGDILGVCLALIFLVVYFGVFGLLGSRFLRGFGFACLVLSFVELLVLLFVLYSDLAGFSIVGLLRFNFWVMAFLGFGVFFITAIFMVFELVSWGDVGLGDGKKVSGWRREGGGW